MRRSAGNCRPGLSGVMTAFSLILVSEVHDQVGEELKSFLDMHELMASWRDLV